MIRRKIVGILMTVSIVISLIPTNAFAAGYDRANKDENVPLEAVATETKNTKYNPKRYFSPNGNSLEKAWDGSFDQQYEYDWGIVGIMANSPGASIFNRDYPQPQGTGTHILSRYTRKVVHENNSFRYMSIRASEAGETYENDLRGWEYNSSKWADLYKAAGFSLWKSPKTDPMVPNQKGSIPVQTFEDGKTTDSNGRRYSPEYLSDYFSDASDTYYVRTFMPPTNGNTFSSNDYFEDGGNNFVPWKVGTDNEPWLYKRWAVVWYKREKALPSIIESRIDLADGSKKYDGGEVLWTNNGNVSYFVEAMDNYLESYGQTAQWDAGIKELWMGVGGSDVSVIRSKNRENNSSQTTTYRPIDTNQTEVNADKVGQIDWSSDTALLDRGFNQIYAGNTFKKWKKGSMKAPTMIGKQSLSLENGQLVTPVCDATNKQGISVSDTNCTISTTAKIAQRSAHIGGIYINHDNANAMIGFHYYKGGDTSSSANEGKIYRDVAIDQTAPLGAPMTYDDNEPVVDQVTLRINDVADISGADEWYENDKTVNGCGVKSVTAKIYDPSGKDISDEIKLTQGSTQQTVCRGTRGFFATFPYSSTYSFTEGNNVYGQYKIVYTLTDNLDNSRTYETTFMRDDPLKSEPQVDLVSWKYSEPGTNQRWVNTTDTFKIGVDTHTTKFRTAIYPSSHKLYLKEIASGATDYSVDSKESKKSEFVRNFSVSSVQKVENNYFAGGTTSVRWSNNDEGTYWLSNLSDYLANENAHGKKFRLWSDSTVSYNGRSKTSKVVGEKDGEIVCVDAEAPRFTYEQTDISTCNFTVSETGKTDESGISKIVITTGNGVVLFNKTFDTKAKKEMTFSGSLDHGDYKSATATVTDNVGNTKDYPMSFIEIDTDLDLTVITQGGYTPRKLLKVTGKGEVVKNPINDTPQFRLREDSTFTDQAFRGYPNKYTPNFVDSPKLNKQWLIDDVYNEGYPAINGIGIEPNGDVKITWGRISDPVLSYAFAIDCNVTGTEIGGQGTHVRNSKSIDFCSGEDRYAYKLFYTGATQTEPNADSTPIAEDDSFSIYKMKDGAIKKDAEGNPIVKDDSEFVVPNLNAKTLLSGWYKFEVTMLDFNGNKSGTSEKWFYFERPQIYLPMKLQVTAVKDVSWEKAPYPYNYELDEAGVPVAGTQSDKFPIGSSLTGYKAPGTNSTAKIKLGYMINYNFTKDGIENLDSLDLTYKFVDSSDYDKELNVTIGGKSVEAYDAENNSNIGSKTFTKAELAPKTMYMKHFIPANAEVRNSDGSIFDGDITVIAVFKCKEGEMNSEFEVPLYTVTTSSSSLNDLDDNKQR